MASNLPTLPPHDAALLEDFLLLDANIQALAAKVNRPLHKLLDWALSPAIAAYIAAFKHFAIYREQARQLEALTKLSATLKALEDPVQVRLTATTILRASNNLLYARPPRPHRDPDEPDRDQHPAERRTTTHQRRAPAPPPPKPDTPPIHSGPRPMSDVPPLLGSVPPITPFPTQVALDLSPPIQPPRPPRPERRNQAQSLSLAAGAPHSRAP